MNRRTVLSSAMAGWVVGLGWLALPEAGWSMALTQLDASAGLRAALDRGAKVAIAQLGRTDGFLGNDKIRIPLPEVLEKAAPLLRAIGRSSQLDELITAMNRAAESAVPMAMPLLSQAIRTLSVQDAQRIVQGGENGVTRYFAERTREPLGQQFLPVVSKVIDKFSLAQRYNELISKAATVGLAGNASSTVQEHVTQRALDGLYFVIGEEERRIRRDPVGTGSAILKRVFGAL